MAAISTTTSPQQLWAKRLNDKLPPYVNFHIERDPGSYNYFIQFKFEAMIHNAFTNMWERRYFLYGASMDPSLENERLSLITEILNNNYQSAERRLIKDLDRGYYEDSDGKHYFDYWRLTDPADPGRMPFKEKDNKAWRDK